ncbi:unnamed protein product [Ilex paraguariensis]|uniref:Uncharacterized protein n=1 Tax=Ilex paraguariensis TaxID=185542 RepID=A0ABC8T7Z6_9AQUA
MIQSNSPFSALLPPELLAAVAAVCTRLWVVATGVKNKFKEAISSRFFLFLPPKFSLEEGKQSGWGIIYENNSMEVKICEGNFNFLGRVCSTSSPQVSYPQSFLLFLFVVIS